jgi:hypothetical protein
VASLILLLIVVWIVDGIVVPPEDDTVNTAELARFDGLLLHLGYITRGFFTGLLGILGHVSEISDVHRERCRGPSTRQHILPLLALMFGLFLTLTYEAVRRRRHPLDLVYFLSFRRAVYI